MGSRVRQIDVSRECVESIQPVRRIDACEEGASKRCMHVRKALETEAPSSHASIPLTFGSLHASNRCI